MKKKMIFVLGTGRCGTMSLQALLNEQPGTMVTHELCRMSWAPDLVALGMSIERIWNREERTVGDCGFWYLNYAKTIIQYKFVDNVYFICLKRDKEQTVESYMQKTPNTNYWTEEKSEHFDVTQITSEEWYRCYPHYNLPKREALERYYDDYYETAKLLGRRYDNFRVFDMNTVLNDGYFQEEMLKFVKMEQPVLKPGIKLNEGRHGGK